MNRQASLICLTTVTLLLLSSIAATTSYTNTNNNNSNSLLPKAEAQTAITLSGRVTYPDGATSMPNAIVQLEGYKTTFSFGVSQTITADSFGVWSKQVPSGYTYTVTASKYGFSMAKHPSQFTASQSNINISIGPQTTKILDIFVTADDEFRSSYGASWASTAWSKITGKETSYFRNFFNIRFNQKYTSSAWTSPSGQTQCSSLASDAASDTGWYPGNTYQGADVLFALTKQPTQMYSGTVKVDGCMRTGGSDVVPSGDNQHPYGIVNDNISGDIPGTINHEIIHMYGFNHHATYYDCTMNDGTQGARVYDQLEPGPGYDHTMAMATSPKRAWY